VSCLQWPDLLCGPGLGCGGPLLPVPPYRHCRPLRCVIPVECPPRDIGCCARGTGVACLQEPTHGVIDLAECLTVKSADEKTDKAHSFEVATPDQTYYMYAANEKEKDDWIGAIGR
jgi:hypothetical protein